MVEAEDGSGPVYQVKSPLKICIYIYICAYASVLVSLCVSVLVCVVFF